MPGQELALRIAPSYGIPVGAESGIFSPLNLGGSVSLGFAPTVLGPFRVTPELGIGYTYAALLNEGASLATLEASAGVSAGLGLTEWLVLRMAVFGRYARYTLAQAEEDAETSGASPGLGLETGLDVPLWSHTVLGIGVAGGWDFGMVGYLRPYLSAMYRVGGTNAMPAQSKEDGRIVRVSAQGPEPVTDSNLEHSGGGLALRLAPAYSIPLGAESGIFGPLNIGSSVSLGFGQVRAGAFTLRPEAGAAYTYSRLAVAENTLASLEGQAGMSAALSLGGPFALRGALFGRYAWYALDQVQSAVSGGSAGIGLELGTELALSPFVDLGIGVGGVWDFGMVGYLRPYLAVTYTIGAGVSPGKDNADVEEGAVVATGSPGIAMAADEALSLELDSVFPVYYKHYDENPFGIARVSNTSRSTWSSVSVTISMKQVMDSPRTLRLGPSLAPGETVAIPASALFNDSILSVTEATKLTLDAVLEYREGSRTRQLSRSASLRVYDRNAMTWADDRSAAAFVSAKDPVVLAMAKSLAGEVNSSRNTAISEKLQLVAAVHNALCQYGIHYVRDPTSVFSGSKATSDVDFLQFPRQTLEYRSGDCDDLSILYCAFLEAVGVETAFITVPGHIFIAASIGSTPGETKSTFSKVDDFILDGEHTWLPLEATMRKGGFLPAWTDGARQWREHHARGQAKLLPLRDAWSVYEPVALPGTADLAALDTKAAVRAMGADIEAFVLREVSARAARLQADVQRTSGSARSANSLGVLYARYGLLDKAKAVFEDLVRKEEYAPALVNLGNIAKLEGRTDNALKLYERAYKSAPSSALVVLALARTNHELENYGLARKQYADLARLDPALAARYSYLDLKGEEGSRAAEAAGLRDAVEWMEAK